MAKEDCFQTMAGLIANAVSTAKVLGENRRVNRLVVGSLGRYMRELDATPGGPPGEGLLDFSLDCLQEAGPQHVPELAAAIQALRAGEGI